MRTIAPSLFCLLLAVVEMGFSAGCNGCRKAGGDGSQAGASCPPCAAEDPALEPVLEFRREMTDSKLHPVRGPSLTIDAAAFSREIALFLEKHGVLVLRQLNHSIDGLQVGKIPAEPSYKRLVAFEDMRAFQGLTLINLSRPDIKVFFRMVQSSLLPLLMRNELALSPEEAGMWMSFLAFAEPGWRVCAREGDSTLAICADYGFDVFVLRLSFEKPFTLSLYGRTTIEIKEGMWVPRSFAWWRWMPFG